MDAANNIVGLLAETVDSLQKLGEAMNNDAIRFQTLARELDADVNLLVDTMILKFFQI
jgi:hypothetical protein